MSNKVDDFFFASNAVSAEPDYGPANTFVRTAEAYANATYQSVYIIDYFRKNFLYVSPNPLFLCGMTADKVLLNPQMHTKVYSLLLNYSLTLPIRITRKKSEQLGHLSQLKLIFVSNFAK